MVLLALLMVPFLGTLFAFSGQRAILQSEGGPFEAPFFRGLFHIIGFYMPVLAYFYAASPAWSLAYLIEPLRLPPLFGLALATIAFSGYFFFYLGTRALLRSGHQRIAWLAAGHLALVALLFAAIFRDELLHQGAYHEFHTGVATPLLQDGLAQATVGLLLLIVPAGALMLWNLYHDRVTTLQA